MISSENNLPDYIPGNLYEEDPIGKLFFIKWFSEYYELLEETLNDFGEYAAQASSLSMKADHFSPELINRNAENNYDKIAYHESYKKLEELSYGNGIISIKYDKEWLNSFKNVRHLFGFSLGYMFAQSEMGLYCPICMTDGVGRVLEKYLNNNPNDEVVSKALGHIASKDLEELWQGAMFISEKQGGSDVGANKVKAKKEGDNWYLNGEKWFCSNVDAHSILTLARMPDAPMGTEGLGLFLILREIPENNSSTIHIQKLKVKLGVRSMPTGEVNLENTRAFLLAGEEVGLLSMLEMVNLSRIYNSIASVAIIRRSILEALAFGHEREVFGKKLVEQPLWRSSVSDLIAEQIGVKVLVFETIRLLDKTDVKGTRDEKNLLRLLTSFSKAISAKLAVFCASESMELIGGNAYMDDSILPRLLRDAQVLPIWEGTTHILTLEALRSFQKDAHLILFNKIENIILKYNNQSEFSEYINTLENKLASNKKLMLKLLKEDSNNQQVMSRECLEKLSRTLTMALLLDNAEDLSLKEICLSAFKRIDNREYSIAPLSTNNQVDLTKTEDILIKNAYIKG